MGAQEALLDDDLILRKVFLHERFRHLLLLRCQQAVQYLHAAQILHVLLNLPRRQLWS